MSSSLSVIRSLFRHMAWADARVLEGLRATPGIDLHAHEQFAHILGAESVWLTRILGQPQRVAVWPELSLDECAAMAVENQKGFAALLDEGEIVFAREVTYVNSAGKTFTNRVIDILVHVAMHGSYHRGMISIVTRRGGGVAVPTDFIAFVRGEAAATRFDAERKAGILRS